MLKYTLYCDLRNQLLILIDRYIIHYRTLLTHTCIHILNNNRILWKEHRTLLELKTSSLSIFMQMIELVVSADNVFSNCK